MLCLTRNSVADLEPESVSVSIIIDIMQQCLCRCCVHEHCMTSEYVDCAVIIGDGSEVDSIHLPQARLRMADIYMDSMNGMRIETRKGPRCTIRLLNLHRQGISHLLPDKMLMSTHVL